jgi:hypothetical protein
MDYLLVMYNIQGDIIMSSAIWNDNVPARQGTTTFKHIEFPLLMHSNSVSSLSFTALNAQ